MILLKLLYFTRTFRCYYECKMICLLSAQLWYNLYTYSKCQFTAPGGAARCSCANKTENWRRKIVRGVKPSLAIELLEFHSGFTFFFCKGLLTDTYKLGWMNSSVASYIGTGTIHNIRTTVNTFSVGLGRDHIIYHLHSYIVVNHLQ